MDHTLFHTFYQRNDMPVVVDFDGATRKIQWKVEIEMLDYHHYLPIFFEGLREPEDPEKFLADRGIDELIANGRDKILPVLPQLIIPIKAALQTKRKEVVVKTLKKLQLLVRSSDAVAESLVPYYRQILPVMNLLRHRNSKSNLTSNNRIHIFREHWRQNRLFPEEPGQRWRSDHGDA